MSRDQPEGARENPLWPGRPQTPSYAVLLQVGFSVPALSPTRRWALTSPFHPYRPERAAVYFLWHFPWGRPRFALRITLPYEARTFLWLKRISDRRRLLPYETM